jgi:hypothetical protein
LEDLPDPDPVIISEPTSKFISNLTIKPVPVSDILTSDPTLNISSTCNQETSPVPLISLVSAETFIRSMQSEGAQCFSVLAHKPLKPDPSNKPKFNPNLDDVPKVYHEFADVFSK